MNIAHRFKRLILSVMVFIGLTAIAAATTDVRCAIVQFTDHYPNEVPLDANRLEAQFRKAANNGAKIIVAPENCLYRIESWSLNGVTQAHLASYFDQMVAKFSALAAELNVCLVIGLREPTGLPKPTYQSAIFLGPDGSLLKTYRKGAIGNSELGYTESGGSDFNSFNTPYGKVWMQICKDMDFDYTINMPTDIDLLIGISKDASRGWSKVVNGSKKARCYGIGANWGTGGNSGFVNPSGSVVASAGIGETIIYATIPLPTLPLDAYEPDGSASTAKSIGNGQTQSRSIHMAGDTDWAKFVVGGSSAHNLQIETAGSSGDTQMWLTRENGSLAAFNDNGGAGSFSRISMASLPAGTYYVMIRENGNNGTIPAYTLKASWAVDSLTISSSSIAVPAPVGNRTLSVAANLSWTATANQPWITIIGGSSGSGNGTVIYKVATNAGGIRSGAITVSGGGISRTFTVNQWPASTHPLISAESDFDGNFRTDFATFQPTTGLWKLLFIGYAQWTQSFGSQSMLPVPADYDGDGLSDLALFQPTTGDWYLLYSSGGSRKIRFGWSKTVPVPGDYDGDGRTDLALFYPNRGQWYFLCTQAGGYSVQFGGKSDIPVPADYDGDGATDIAVYRPSSGMWYVIYSGGGYRVQQLGWSGTIPVPGDYDGDGQADLAVLSRNSSKWCITYSGGGSLIMTYGYKTMTPVQADYDGDGATDIAMYHEASGTWYIRESATGRHRKITYGGPGKIPVLLYPMIYSWFGLP